MIDFSNNKKRNQKEFIKKCPLCIYTQKNKMKYRRLRVFDMQTDIEYEEQYLTEEELKLLFELRKLNT